MRAVPLVPRGLGPDQDQPLLDAGAAGAPWRPPRFVQAPLQAREEPTNLTSSTSPSMSCGHADGAAPGTMNGVRCGSCGSTLFSPQPSMATDPAAGMNGRWCFAPGGPWNFEPNEPTFAPGSAPTMSWGIPRGAILGPCRVSHGPERVHHLTPVLTDLGMALKRKDLRVKLHPMIQV